MADLRSSCRCARQRVLVVSVVSVGDGHRTTTTAKVVVGDELLDLGDDRVFPRRARAPRVRCRDHGVIVAAVPWARHRAGHTRDFDDLAAWLAVRTSKSAVMELLRVAWRTVGSIVTRVNADIDNTVDRLEGLRRIGIDEISYKRGHRYLIVVVDHDRGHLVWAGPGRNDAALNVFFDELGHDRAALLTHVSADMADWIARVVAKRAPERGAYARTRSMWSCGQSTRSTSNDAEHGTKPKAAVTPERSVADPTAPWGRRETHRAVPLRALEEPGRPHRPPTPPARLDREDHPTPVAGAYLLKEGLRYVFAVKGEEGKIGGCPGSRGI